MVGRESKEQRQGSPQQNESEVTGGRPLSQSMDITSEATQRSIDRFQEAIGTFWEEAGQDAYGPMMRNVARANLELIGWMGRRAQAAAEMPGHLVRCQTPQDLLTEHGRFLQEMVRDFTGTTTRVLSMWSEELPGKRGGQSARK